MCRASLVFIIGATRWKREPHTNYQAQSLSRGTTRPAQQKQLAQRLPVAGGRAARDEMLITSVYQNGERKETPCRNSSQSHKWYGVKCNEMVKFRLDSGICIEVTFFPPRVTRRGWLVIAFHLRPGRLWACPVYCLVTNWTHIHTYTHTRTLKTAFLSIKLT